MISQSITFPQALWEQLFDSHSHKAYGNDVAISKYSSLKRLLVRVFPQRLWKCCIHKVYHNCCEPPLLHRTLTLLEFLCRAFHGCPYRFLHGGSKLSQNHNFLGGFNQILRKFEGSQGICILFPLPNF